jgi:hypothetical protein
MRRALPWLAIVPAAIAAAAVAQPSSSGGAAPVLHEDLAPPAGTDGNSPLVGTGSAGQNPAGLASGDKILPRPVAGPKQAGEPVFGDDGLASDRNTEWRADLDTGADGTLHYAAVFNPDVVPFKRMSVLDAVRDDYTMFTVQRALTEVPVGGALQAARDPFWASIVVELEPGRDVAIPSVAPDMRILSVETTPTTRVVFSRDGADNFFVRSDEPSARGQVRLVFMVDADAGYFAPALPAGRLTPRQLGEAAPAGLVPALPATVRAAAMRTLRNLDLDEDMPLGKAFDKLIAYFRAFEAKPPPASSGDIYRDLVDNQAGVCRHRSFGFMVTANALGIPTRYVTNEAHAFVEVWFAERGWQRIDLGGAALRMEVSGAEGKTLHRPRAEDPFAKPDNYGNNYSQLGGDVGGLSRQQLEDKQASLAEEPASGEPQMGGGGGSGSGAGSGGSQISMTPDGSLPGVTTDPAKRTLTLRVAQPAAVAYRGDPLTITGTIEDRGAGVSGHPVSIFLAQRGLGGEGAILVGSGLSGADGTFAVQASLPSSLDLLEYEVFAVCNEDARFNAATSP